jgi:hypothetical protein
MCTSALFHFAVCKTTRGHVAMLFIFRVTIRKCTVTIALRTVDQPSAIYATKLFVPKI